MIKTEYEEFKKNFEINAIKQHTENQNLIDLKEIDYKKYHEHYMKEHIKYSYNVDNEPYDEIMKELSALKENTHKVKNYPEFFLTLEATAYNDYESASIDEIIFKATWNQPMDYDELQSEMKRRFRMKLGEKLRPSSVNSNASVMAECKAVQMFEENELTWKGLQRMTYGQCDL